MRKKTPTALSILAVALLATSGCAALADAMDDGNTFEDRAEAISAVYDQGKSARGTMEKTGIVVDEASCGNSWVTSGAKDAESDMRLSRRNDQAFQERRRLSFINGCMDRPNSLPPVADTVSLPPSPDAE